MTGRLVSMGGRAELVVEFTQPPADHGYGLVTYFNVPGGFRIQLYQPKYR